MGRRALWWGCTHYASGSKWKVGSLRVLRAVQGSALLVGSQPVALMGCAHVVCLRLASLKLCPSVGHISQGFWWAFLSGVSEPANLSSSAYPS